MKQLIFFLLVLLMPSLVWADDPPVPSVNVLSRAIFRAKTGPRADMRWGECNRVIRREAAAERAREYAGYLMEEYRADPEFEPWIAASIIAQESSFNRCAVSRGAWRTLRASFLDQFGRPLVEDDLRRILRSPALRRRLGVHRFDAGLAQFRWPGTIARHVGVSDPADLIDARQNIRMLAASFRSYREVCATTSRFTGVYTRPIRGTDRVRVIHYSVACMDAYWVQHNTGGPFNYRYFRNVKRWYDRLSGEYARSTTIEAYDGNG